MTPDTASPLRDYLLILRRRKWLFALPAALVFALAVVFALVQTPIYRSEATILIEDAEIPDDLVTSLVGDYIEERLEAIDRRVMVTDSLLAIIERYDLYPDARERLPVTEIVEAMRDNIRREMIRAEVVDPRTGQERAATVAFELSFDHPQPETAQRITNELVSLYLNQNLRRRQELASETAGFFRDERERAEGRIEEIEKRLAEFKRANSGSLPDQLPYNQQIIARTEQELRDLDRQLQALKEREGFLEVQLALTEPLSLGGNGNGYQSPAAQLAGKRTELATLRARYGPEHPDIIKLEREVAALEQTTGVGRSTDVLEQERARLQGELDALRRRYAEVHPDVRQARRALEGIEAELRAAGNRPAAAAQAASARTNNPLYIQLQADLNAAQAEMAAIVEQRRLVADKLEQHQQLVLNTPLVEREYAQLRRSLDDAMAMRDELARKETTATLGQTLEAELKAERLSLIEPPFLPTEPVKPDRGMILLIGFVLAVGCGGGLVASAQAFDEGVYAKDIEALIGEAPLAVVPRITTEAERARGWATAAAVLALTVGGLGAAAWWVHTRYVPLDIAYYDLQRRARTTVEPYFPATTTPRVQPTAAEER